MGTFAQSDAAYLTQRRALAEQYGPRPLWAVIDRWPLYVGIQNLMRNAVLMQCLEQALSVPGHCVEFGAWHGATTLLWAKLLQVWAPLSPKVVHAFDTWEAGFSPAQWQAQDNPAVQAQYAGTYAGDAGTLADMIRLYSLEDSVTLHQGRIEDTWPAFLAATPGFRASLVLLDVDLYGPTQAALQGLHERLSLGGMILADEYGHEDWPGETQAVDEFLAAHPGCYRQEVPRSRQPTLLLTKIHG